MTFATECARDLISFRVDQKYENVKKMTNILKIDQYLRSLKTFFQTPCRKNDCVSALVLTTAGENATFYIKYKEIQNLPIHIASILKKVYIYNHIYSIIVPYQFHIAVYGSFPWQLRRGGQCRAFLGGTVLISHILGYTKKKKKLTPQNRGKPSPLVDFLRFLDFSAIMLHYASIFKDRKALNTVI